MYRTIEAKNREVILSVFLLLLITNYYFKSVEEFRKVRVCIGKLVVRLLRVTLLGYIRHLLNCNYRYIAVELCNLTEGSNLHVEESALDTKASLNLADDVGIHE